MLKVVEVELVIVPVVRFREERIRFDSERLVIVAEVIVALVPIALMKFEVEALVVEA